MTERNTAFTRDLPVPNRFSRGQIFAFSGLAGDNSCRQDLCGVLTGEGGEIRFAPAAAADGILLRFTEAAHDYDAVLPDLIAAEGGAILVTFADRETIVGRCDTLPAVRQENEAYLPGSRTVLCGAYAFSLAAIPAGGGYAFALCRRKSAEAAETDAQNALRADVYALADAVLDWYQACPPCPNPHFEKLWYKCLSVNRASVFTPQDGFAHAFTTADRLHPQMRTADACFAATAMVHYAPERAKDFLLSAFDRLCADDRDAPGTQTDADNIDDAHPPVLCASVWNLFDVTGSIEILEKTAEPLRRLLLQFIKNRRSPNGVMTDTAAEPIESVALSVFMAAELQCMHRIYMTLDDHMSALQMDELSRALAERINMRLWDERSHCYYDRTSGGAFCRTLSSKSFLPLYAGVCDPRQAHRLVAHLTPMLDLPFPIPSGGETGSAQITENFLVYVGLQRYGFGTQAARLRQKTLEAADRLLAETGSVCAVYGPNAGNPLYPPADNNTGASLIELLLWS